MKIFRVCINFIIVLPQISNLNTLAMTWRCEKRQNDQIKGGVTLFIKGVVKLILKPICYYDNYNKYINIP